MVAGVVRVEVLSPFASVSQTLALLWEFAGTQVAALSWLTKFPLECFFPVIPLPSPAEAWPPWCQAQDELDFICLVCKNPPCTHSSASTCFLPMFSESVDIQKCLLKQLFDQPHQLALPFSSKTASFYSLLKIAISLKPEDTVIHVVVKRKKGYFFCFGLWEESYCAIPVPAGLLLAPPWPSWPHHQPQWFWHSLLCHLAAIWDAGVSS